jgi:hypothetical protein
MKKRFAYILIFLFSILMLLPFLGKSQGGTWPIKYNDSDPSGAPSAAGTRLYFNTATNTLWFWEPAPSAQWRKQPKAFDQISGCAAPAYTPTARQSTFAVNSCTPKPELYQWTGSAWAILNPETLYTEGTGIDITGGVITNTSPDQTVTMTDGTGIDVTGTYPNFTVTNSAPNIVQTLSIAGQDLTLSGGGGTVEIPVGSSDALGTGFIAGGGTGTIPDGTIAGISGSGLQFSGQAPFLVFTDNGGGSGANVEIIQEGIINMSVYDDRGSSLVMALSPSDGSFTALKSNLLFKAGDNQSAISFNMNDLAALLFDASANTVKFSDVRATPIGIEYASYYPDIETSPQSLTDVQTVTSLKQKLATYTESERDAISSPATGYIIFCTDATANDSSTGVMQVWNGSAWKNAW